MNKYIEYSALIAALIFIFTVGYFAGAYNQLQEDHEMLNTYETNETQLSPRCLSCECYTPDPYRYVERPLKTEELKAVVVKQNANI